MPLRWSKMAGATRRELREGWEICATPPGACQSPADLDSTKWQCHQGDAPSTVASVLRASGLWSLDGPERSFDAEDWWYRLRFDGTDLSDTATLGLEGLATLCDVWLNGELILRSENMFRSHTLRVSGLRPHGNELALAFRSLEAALKAKRPRPRWRAPMVENQQLRWHRTTLLGRTPGWSPPVAAVGPWRPVWIEPEEPGIMIDDLRAISEGEAGRLEINGRVRAPAAVRSIKVLMLAGEEVMSSADAAVVDGRFEAVLRVESVERWWPHTHGTPVRYGVVVRTTDATGATRDWPAGHVGFRDVAVECGDSRAFSVQVNGVPVFCRGACWTPLDVVSLRGSADEYRAALLQVVDAGFNMLRLSGAMVYEEEVFLDLCDELGILVWQDFMFANMDYPASDAGFLESVRQEAAEHLAWWARHPCVAVICGNSEVSQQAAMWGTSRDQWNPPLFADVLRDLSGALCPRIPYWPSSAWGGDLPFQVDAGTTSYYGVGAYLRPLDDARRSGLLFATECLGFANIPEPDTMDSMPGGSAIKVHHPSWKRRVPRDLGAGWDFDDVRDWYLKLLFDAEPLQLRYADHQRYLELGRRVPSEVMVSAFAEWRRSQSDCGGAMIWFLRDLWSGAGWGIIDALGRPKAPWYALRRSLQPQWLSITDEGLNGLALHVGNERPEELQASIALELFRNGRSLVARGDMPVTVPSRGVAVLKAASFLAEFHDLTHAYRFGPLSCDLVLATLTGADGSKVAQAFHLPSPKLHSTPVERDLLAASARRLAEPGEFELTVLANAFARSVHVDAPGYAVDDQYFNMAPGSQVVVRLRSRTNPVPGLFGTVTALNSAVPARIEIRS